MAITLRELRSRDVHIQWFEGVAIVQSLCEWTLARRPDEPRFPDIEDVRIETDGSVVAEREGSPGASGIERAARLLESLVAESEMPVKLRLAVVTALSPAPAYGSLREFSRALAYFERPGRNAQIASLYALWQGAPPRADNDRREPEPAPLSRPAKETRPRRRWSTRKRLLAAGAVVAVAVLVAAFVWMYPLPTLTSAVARSRLAGSVSSAVETVGSTLSTGLEALGRQVGLLPADPVTEPPAAPEPPVVPPRRPRARRIEPVVVDTPAATLSFSMPPFLPPTIAPAAEVRITDAATEPPETIRTAADPDVDAPLLLRPQLPSEPPPGVEWDTLPIMEVLVDERGEVVTARLLTLPRGVQDSMLVSAAKAWSFRPAMRDGRPVPYRMRIRITLQ